MGCRWEMCYSWGCCACGGRRWGPRHRAAPRRDSTGCAPRGGDAGGWHGVAPQAAGMATPGSAPLSHRPPQGPKEAEPPPEKVHSPALLHLHPRSWALSGPTPCTHVGQDPVVTQRAGMPGAGEGAGFHGRQTGAEGRAEHTWSIAPALPGCRPAPAGLRGSYGTAHRTPARVSARSSHPHPALPWVHGWSWHWTEPGM